MEDQNSQVMKRKIAYKFRIGDVISGKPILFEDKLKHVEIFGREVVRLNLIANVIDKYVQDGEKKFGSVTLDDATGQIKLKLFGEDVSKIEDLNQGDTVMVVGLLRSWNNEVYITPEIIKKKDPAYLLVRKLESDLDKPKVLDREKVAELKEKILSIVKEKDSDGGVEIAKIITDLKESPDVINREIKKILEDGLVYEPRPGKLRYLG